MPEAHGQYAMIPLEALEHEARSLMDLVTRVRPAWLFLDADASLRRFGPDRVFEWVGKLVVETRKHPVTAEPAIAAQAVPDVTVLAIGPNLSPAHAARFNRLGAMTAKSSTEAARAALVDGLRAAKEWDPPAALEVRPFTEETLERYFPLSQMAAEEANGLSNALLGQVNDRTQRHERPDPTATPVAAKRPATATRA